MTPTSPLASAHPRAPKRFLLLGMTFCALSSLLATPAASQDGDLEDVLGGIGTASTVEDRADALPSNLAENEGSIGGEVIDAETGVPIQGVTVILIWPGGSAARQEVQITGPAGMFEFARVPAGSYTVSFIKSGYRASEMKNFGVIAGEYNAADFPMPPQKVAESGEVLDLEAFVVEASMVGDLMTTVELRMDSDSLVNLMSAEDFSKFAASDVGDALKRVAGINVVSGRFAVIRGLEDRYSSTLFNGAPVPSSDPTRQSVQLDLFPSDVVSSLSIEKAFVGSTPGNSAAGSIDILTMGYPDELTLRLSGGSGFNQNAIDTHLQYETDSPIGRPVHGSDVIEWDVNGSIGGRKELLGREFRFKAVYAHELDFDTAIGTSEAKEPRISKFRKNNRTGVITVQKTGGLALGELDVSDGQWDLTLSTRTEQDTYFGALGYDFDEAGNHRIDATLFYTRKQLEANTKRENGFIPGFDYQSVPNFAWTTTTLYGARDTAVATLGSQLNDFRLEFEKPATGPFSFLPMFREQSIVQDRSLQIYQLNAEHDFVSLDDLKFTWAANYAKTSQEETAFRAGYWYEPNELVNQEDEPLPIPPSFPAQVSDFDPDGSFRTNGNSMIYLENDIQEQQYFFRGDFLYDFEPYRNIVTELAAGVWYERSNRRVDFLQDEVGNPIDGLPGVIDGQYMAAGSPGELGSLLSDGYGLGSGIPNVSNFEREIIAGYFDGKFTFWEDVDVIGGVRIEGINIISENRSFSGGCAKPNGQGPNASDPTKQGNCPEGYLPRIFPGRYLYLDRLDNEDNPFFAEDPDYSALGVSNDRILGIDLPTDANGFVDLLSREEVVDAMSGEIDELEVLPLALLAYRTPIEGLTLRGAYSQTVARPSFRELCYCATLVPGIPDRIVGNPNLTLSHVQSFDLRGEYFWGDLGELFAVSVFYKEIDNPIELIVLRDFSVRDYPYFEGPFRVYRNNENTADLLGVEVEGRFSLGHIERLGSWADTGGFLDYFSIGGNYTYIDASVERSPFEIGAASTYYLATDDDIADGTAKFSRLPKERRLFNQPSWIANADFSFDQPDWGTRFTLSFFAISDVLMAAGAGDIGPNGVPESYVLDEFIDSYYQLDFVVSQSFAIPQVPGEWTFRTSIKNLTDSERGVVYDSEPTNKTYAERNFTVGRDFSFSLGYQITF